jgi:hypothetical protein
MRKTLYLIRHGLLKQDDHNQLNEKGLEFASKLHNIINYSKIDFIAYVDGKNRCEKTVEKLAYLNGIDPQPYISDDFKNLTLYHEALKYENSVICYGYEEVGEILIELKIEIENKDELYEIILKINLEDKTYQKIPTGYSKTK